MNIDKLLREMTIEEKVSMVIGESFWGTRAVDRLGIRTMILTDGPHGVRRQMENEDHLGQAESLPSSAFPSLVNVASTWDRDLAYKQGSYLATEAKGLDVDIVLGPGANIKRSPLCGRNFEYFSEDPYVSGRMAKSLIDGLQDQNVGACIKHFFGNNQEKNRLTIDAVIDERAINEIYFRSFEYPIKEAKPYMVMAAYNRVNGEFGAENGQLLRGYLRKECGYDGVVVTDWGGVNDIVKGVKNTLDLEMPSSGSIHYDKLMEAIETGELKEDTLDQNVGRILMMHQKVQTRESIEAIDYEAQHEGIKAIGRGSVVLLKNENKVLPLKKEDSIVVVGEFALKPRFQGGGSSNINPNRLTNTYDELRKAYPELVYHKGFDVDGVENNEDEIVAVLRSIKPTDKVLIFAGLSEKRETEGKDREHLRLPANQIKMIHALSAVNDNVIVVLSNGSALEMDFHKDVSAIVEGYLLGQASGEVLVEILTGAVNPSGKLAETFPLSLKDTPCFTSFPGNTKEVRYDESIFVGYRHYDTRQMEVLYPFGHGLSYTDFDYSNLKLSSSELKSDEVLKVSLDVTNIGERDGKEVVQLYISQENPKEVRPEKELRGFWKIALKKDETKTVTFEISKEDLAYYSTYYSAFVADDSVFTVKIGSSSRDIRLSGDFRYQSETKQRKHFNYTSTFGEVLAVDDRLGKELVGQFKVNSGIDWDLGDRDENFAEEVIAEFQLKSMVLFTKGEYTYEMLDGLLERINRG